MSSTDWKVVRSNPTIVREPQWGHLSETFNPPAAVSYIRICIYGLVPALKSFRQKHPMNKWKCKYSIRIVHTRDPEGIYMQTKELLTNTLCKKMYTI